MFHKRFNLVQITCQSCVVKDYTAILGAIIEIVLLFLEHLFKTFHAWRVKHSNSKLYKLWIVRFI